MCALLLVVFVFKESLRFKGVPIDEILFFNETNNSSYLNFSKIF